VSTILANSVSTVGITVQKKLR